MGFNANKSGGNGMGTKILMSLGVVILVLLSLPIVWMNATPGYFQEENGFCACHVIYVQDKNNPVSDWEPGKAIPMCIRCSPNLLDRFAISLAVLDFNR